MERLAGGHIHDTFTVTTGAGAYILQRLNGRVFPDLGRLTATVTRVTDHLRRAVAGRPQPHRRAVTPVEAVDGGTAVVDEEGRWWRAFVRIGGAGTPDRVDEPGLAFQVGATAGRFLVDLDDLPGPPLDEAIPGFHDMAARRSAFREAVDTASAAERAGGGAEIEAVLDHASVVDELAAARGRGVLPERTVHNDAKAANVLVDERTGEGLCMVDLDTVAPGTSLFDFGDLVRSTAGASEDDVGTGSLRVDVVEGVTKGYLSTAGEVLRPEEVDLLPLGALLMTWEAASRFLADHLAGDVYYRVDHRGHNLERARAQLRLLEALAGARPRLTDIVGRAARR